ncbi:MULTISPECIES: 4-carboxy-4-hydroxy-2-oxoadipate aldolase/oxaloacetate decarboxylase [unclassified Streptomyces]|uniref:4-carboxy-4-hydroxy-2-oxoadipate aldolase/oxaloacetate decarboxylase n=1 Tax=unclassified Streptomyces TaxID=2593676 RepID=UPI00081F18D0|nr:MULTISPECIES: 4-carboxy-4-hydroxy-2-oxoadipate aldolase/oxaloacetate decarboxylase [unclassified Streptomyces]MYZ35213.1 4-carboxy-4-hydroxy-2-oxoadipate aldolase/oxaloacetate decarboxylase [Streptomyces sp. SID4917]SCF73645.1 4-hydroxy-4-methyl-2-oxoglutarate aldolase [Streptomyces sp. MnatMP-M17]
MTTAPTDPTDTAVFLRLGTATLYEASKLDCFLPPRIRPVWPGAAVVGRALPVTTAPADNLPLHIALEHASPGDVLVVDGQREECGYWGEVLTAAAQARGVVGLVIDGGVRDVDQLRERGFPVFSSSIAVRTTVKNDTGTVGDPIALGTAAVSRGDLVVADTDGVVVIPRASVASVLERGRAREAAEAGYLSRIAQGELTLDIYGFRPAGTD